MGLRALLAAALAAVTAACSGAAAPSSLDEPATSPATFGALPDVQLVDAAGAAVSPMRLRGSTWALACLTRPQPIQTGALLAELREVGDVVGGGDVHLVLVSVDPLRDTPEVLADLAPTVGFDVEGRHLWTGTEAAVAELLRGAYRSALVGATADELELQMAMAFEPRAVVVDPAGQVRGTYDLLSAAGSAALVERLKAVSRE